MHCHSFTAGADSFWEVEPGKPS